MDRNARRLHRYSITVRGGARQARSVEQNRRYEEYLLAAEEALRRTHTGWAPWAVVEATDPFYAWWQVCETTAVAMTNGLLARGIDPARLDEQMLADEDGVSGPCAGYLDEGSVG